MFCQLQHATAWQCKLQHKSACGHKSNPTAQSVELETRPSLGLGALAEELPPLPLGAASLLLLPDGAPAKLLPPPVLAVGSHAALVGVSSAGAGAGPGPLPAAPELSLADLGTDAEGARAGPMPAALLEDEEGAGAGPAPGALSEDKDGARAGAEEFEPPAEVGVRGTIAALPGVVPGVVEGTATLLCKHTYVLGAKMTVVCVM